MKNRDEKLDALLRQFMDDDHAHDLKEDLSYADRVFAAYPVPAVQQRTLASIQAAIRRKLRRQKYRIAGKWLATAAAVLIAVLLSREHFTYTDNVTTPPVLARSADLWSDELYTVISQDEPIEQELSEIADSLRTVTMETYEPVDTLVIDMMELEEIETLTEKGSLRKDAFYDI
ncbi:MAG: hypothetical protein ABFR90_01830 [Planctomycetota bacterium]